MPTLPRNLGWFLVWTVMAAVAFALLVTGCGPESDDGSGSKNPGPGGRVKVSLQSSASVKVYNKWGDSGPAGKAQVVKPGGTSTYKDADGFCAPRDRSARYVITWALVGREEGELDPGDCRKINNIETATVTVK